MTSIFARRGAPLPVVPLILGAALCPLLMVGCAAGGASAAVQADAAQRVIEAPPADVLTAGTAILRREFGRLSSTSGSRIETEPTEYSTQSESGAARDLYRGRSRMRQSATLTVARGASAASVARLRVVIEREDTGRERAMSPHAVRLGDTPGSETAIEQDAATSVRQNTVWTRVRRNHVLERRLLEELAERFARSMDDVSADVPEPAMFVPVGTAEPAGLDSGAAQAERLPPAGAAAQPPASPVAREADRPSPAPDDQTLIVPAREVP